MIGLVPGECGVDCECFVDLLNHHLSKGFDLRWVDNHGQSLLEWAIVCGTSDMVEMVCSRYDAEAIFSMASALAHAIVFGEEKVCRILLQKGAGVFVLEGETLESLEKVTTLKFGDRVLYLKGK